MGSESGMGVCVGGWGARAPSAGTRHAGSTALPRRARGLTRPRFACQRARACASPERTGTAPRPKHGARARHPETARTLSRPCCRPTTDESAALPNLARPRPARRGPASGPASGPPASGPHRAGAEEARNGSTNPRGACGLTSIGDGSIWGARARGGGGGTRR